MIRSITWLVKVIRIDSNEIRRTYVCQGRVLQAVCPRERQSFRSMPDLQCNTFHPRSLDHGRKVLVPGKVRGYGVGEHKDRGHNQEHVPFDNDNL